MFCLAADAAALASLVWETLTRSGDRLTEPQSPFKDFSVFAFFSAKQLLQMRTHASGSALCRSSPSEASDTVSVHVCRELLCRNHTLQITQLGDSSWGLNTSPDGPL